MIVVGEPLRVPFIVLATNGAEYADAATPPAITILQEDLSFAAATNAAVWLFGGVWALQITAAEMASSVVTIAWRGPGIISGLKSLAVEAEQADQILLAAHYEPVEGPALIIPDSPIDLSLCHVYGYFEDLANLPSQNIKVKFRLAASEPVKSERLISGREIFARIKNGQLIDQSDDAKLYQALQRNDMLTPAGTSYLVTCPEIGLNNVEITLTESLFDLGSVVT